MKTKRFLSPTQKAALRKDARTMTTAELSAKYDVAKSTISKILNGAAEPVGEDLMRLGMQAGALDAIARPLGYTVQLVKL